MARLLAILFNEKQKTFNTQLIYIIDNYPVHTRTRQVISMNTSSKPDPLPVFRQLRGRYMADSPDLAIIYLHRLFGESHQPALEPHKPEIHAAIFN